jgi:hypothetical protein
VLGTSSDASRDGISAALSLGLLRAAALLSRVLAHALLAWCLLVPPLALLLASALRAGLQRRMKGVTGVGVAGGVASPPVSPPASPEPTPRRRKAGGGAGAPAAAAEDALSVRMSPRIAARRHAA